MATQTTQGSGVTNNVGGSLLHGGNVSSSLFRNLSARTSAVRPVTNWGLPIPSPFAFVQASQLGSAVTIAGITQSGSTGYVNINKTTHGLSVGSLIVVYGANVTGYNTVHRVTVVTDADNVQTDVFYSANTSTHGSYKSFSGNFNTLAAGCYIATVIGKGTSGSSITRLRLNGADNAQREAIAMAVGNQRYNITSWNYVTGAATKGANAGDTVQYIKPQGGGALTEEPEPTRAAPGRVVFTSGKALPTSTSYSARTT